MKYKPGPTQRRIMNTILGRGSYLATGRTEQNSCLKLHDRGLLARDPGNSSRWMLNVAGLTLAQQLGLDGSPD